MSTSNPATKSIGGHDSRTVRHSKDDKLTDLQFERLYDASFDLQSMDDLEARFILLVAGRLGLRRGEIAHIQSDWVDWRKSTIDIPSHYDCDLGRDQEECGSCRQYAKQMAEYNDGVSFDDALAATWRPKTDMAVRSVPFGFSPRAEIILDEYFSEFERWMYSSNVINRRVDSLADAAGLDRNIYPHALRATAASFLAGRGMSTLSLQAMFGWSQPSTARNYVAQSSDKVSRELHLING